LKIEKIEDNIKDYNLVSVKKMGHIYELCYTERKNNKASIKLLDKEHYVLMSTGEVFECEHIENRSDNKAQISQSLKRLRDYINTNVIDVSHCKWITLTYKENMQDTKKLYIDFKKFIMRFKYKYGHFEYIVAMEPQARGAWHCHCIIIFDKKAPFIPNNIIENLWQHGFTKTNKLDDIDNIGAYLTAYLGDIEYSEDYGNEKQYNIKIIDTIGNIKLKKPKKFIKGGRLYMYPPNFNLYRISRGIKAPKKEYFQYSFIKEKAGLTQPTYSKAIQLSDTDNNFTNKIIYEYYNTKRNFKKD
jgi:hypothetical protein